jgi:hypothetical protein
MPLPGPNSQELIVPDPSDFFLQSKRIQSDIKEEMEAKRAYYQILRTSGLSKPPQENERNEDEVDDQMGGAS